jgi:hypothetical protein
MWNYEFKFVVGLVQLYYSYRVQKFARVADFAFGWTASRSRKPKRHVLYFIVSCIFRSSNSSLIKLLTSSGSNYRQTTAEDDYLLKLEYELHYVHDKNLISVANNQKLTQKNLLHMTIAISREKMTLLLNI